MADPPAPGGPAHVVGVGVASAATPGEVRDLVADVLGSAGITTDTVTAVATLDTRADHPAIVALGWPVVPVPRSSLPTTPPAAEPAGGGAAGRPVVAEPAALLVAGPRAVLVVPRRRSAHATVAVARVADGS